MKILTKKCIACGKKFTKRINESLKDWEYRHKFCSRSCSAKYKNLGEKTRFKEGHKSWLSGTKGLIGLNSGSFKKGHKTWNKRRKWTKEERQKIADGLPVRMGKDSPNWRGGTTKLGTRIRSLKKYREWRSEVFKRDNWTCQKCGRRRKKGDRVIIHANHLKPFYKILAENKIKTVQDALKCDELWDISNGETLCIFCHRQTDSYLVNQYSA